MSNTKDTIYIDIDDEITSIIDKVKTSKHEVVALVLPKRAAMLQSVVNMRLLKQAGQRARRNLVLITSDHNIMPLAGLVGLHVAKTLESKPSIPPPPEKLELTETIDAGEPLPDTSKTVGELAEPGEETVTVDNGELAAASSAAGQVGKGTKKAGRGGPKVPNFERFRKRLILISAAVVLLISGWFWAFIIAPKASVTISTAIDKQATESEFTAKTDAKELDVNGKIIPAVAKETVKTSTEKMPATGQKNTGAKATGTMTVFNCTDNAVTVPAGTTFTNSGLSFASNENVSVPASNFTSGGVCKKDNSANVGVTATASGDNYNLSAGRTYTSSFASTVTGEGSSMTGGTTVIVKVVAQADIDAAVKRAGEQGSAASLELQEALQKEGYVGIKETLNTVKTDAVSTPKVDEEAAEVTVTVNTTFSVLGVKEDDLKKLLDESVKDSIDSERQTILDYGIASGVFRVVERKTSAEAKINLQAQVGIGPKIDETALKNEIRGKKRGEGESIISSRPGVKEAKIEYSPLWVLSTPKAAKKITIIYEQVQ